MADKPGTLAVDLDGTLAHKQEPFRFYEVGDPYPEMVQRVKDELAKGRKVVLFTARAAKDDPKLQTALRKWLADQGLEGVSKITAVKDHHIDEIWDDRARQAKDGELAAKMAMEWLGVLLEPDSTKEAAMRVRKTKMVEEHTFHCPHCDVAFGEKSGPRPSDYEAAQTGRVGEYDMLCRSCGGIVDSPELTDEEIDSTPWGGEEFKQTLRDQREKQRQRIAARQQATKEASSREDDDKNVQKAARRKPTRLERPENWDPTDDDVAPLRMFIGQNDWEGSTTWAWVEDGEHRIWINLRYPDGYDAESETATLAEDEAARKRARAWRQKWIQAARKHQTKGEPLTLECFQEALKDPEVDKMVGHTGKERAPENNHPTDKQASAQIPTTGPAAILHRLKTLDLAELERKAREDINSGRVTRRDRGVKMMAALQGLKRNEITPDELMITKVPVLPPQFRPFSMLGNTYIPGAANELYQDLLKHQDMHRETLKVLGDAGAADTRLNVWNAVQALYGYGEPVSKKVRDRAPKGFLLQLSGDNPKRSFVQRKLLSKPMDFVGRATITVDPNLKLDEISIPYEMGWKDFGPHVQRRLVLGGMPVQDAIRAVADRTPVAKQALLAEAAERPIQYSRAPAWHKFSSLGGFTRFHDGDNIAINPYVTAGLNADFNGDAQLGKVVLLLPKDKNLINLFSNLQSHVDEATALSMQRSAVIPAFDTTTHDLHLVDLSVFPHGELQRRKLDGKNGEILFYHVPEGLKVVAFDEATGRPVWATVASYSVHPQRLIELVDLSNGRQIYTDDDPRAVYGIDPADPTWQLQRTTPTDAQARKFLVPCVKDIEGACQNLGKLTTMAVPDASVELVLDWDTGWLLGAIAGDGWWDKKDYHFAERRVYLADLEGQNASRMHTILSRYFGCVSWGKTEQFKSRDDSRYGDSVRHTFAFTGGTAFTKFLTTWLDGGATENSTGSASKSIPDMFLMAPREFREGLLNGLVDTDGSCAVSNAKDAQQLLCTMTSTSLRLASDAKFLALTLGIQAAVSYSKTTIRGNTSWITTFSAADCKRLNTFAKLASDHKRVPFLNTEVAMDNTSLVFDKAAVPDNVQCRVAADLHAPKIRVHERVMAGTSDLERRKHQQNVYQQWWKVEDSKLISRPFLSVLFAELEFLQAEAQTLRENAIEDLKQGDTVTPERVALWRSAILATCPKQDEPARVSEAVRIYARTNRPLKTGRCTFELREGIRSWLENTTPYQRAHLDPLVLRWKKQIADVHEISWASITAIQKTGIREDGYDLTVPGYETFMSADGIILSNTINVHVPALPETVQEIKDKLLASKQLFSIRDQDAVMPVPKHEAVLGLFAADKRPAKKVHQFGSRQEAVAALERGDVSFADEIEIPDPL